MTNSAVTYDEVESEAENPDDEAETENFDSNSIVMEIIAYEIDDKNTQARLKRERGRNGEGSEDISR